MSNDSYRRNGSRSVMTQQRYAVQRKKTMNVGEKALMSLKDAQKDLEKASFWGTVDILTKKGGKFSDLVKFSRIRKTRAHLKAAKRDMDTFGIELRELTGGRDIGVDIGAILSFVDFFTDNFIVHIIVQGRIREALREIDNAIYQVENILNRL